MALIVTGHQRSGTTLLSRLFNAHPEEPLTIGELGARIADEVDDEAKIDLRFLPSHGYSYSQRAERPPE